MADKTDLIKDENFYVTHGWMRKKLGLKGNELDVYAIIYGFSQTENQFFTGSHQYLAEWVGVSRQTIITCLNSLIKKGLIIKKEKIVNGVKFCEYKAESLTGYQESLQGDVKIFDMGYQIILQDCQNFSFDTSIIYNISDSIKDNIILEVGSSSPESGNKAEIPAESPKPTEQQKEKIPFKEIQETYNDICKSLPKIIKLSDKRKKTIKERLNDGYTVEQIKKAFEMAEASPFLRGEVNKSFHADFDWIFESDHLLRILENKYADRNAQNQPSTANNQMPESFMKLWK